MPKHYPIDIASYFYCLPKNCNPSVRIPERSSLAHRTSPGPEITLIVVIGGAFIFPRETRESQHRHRRQIAWLQELLPIGDQISQQMIGAR